MSCRWDSINNIRTSITIRLRDYSLKRIESLRSNQSNLSSKFKSVGKLNDIHQIKYYSQWLYCAIHVITSIPEFNTETKIANRLNLSQHQVKSILLELEEMGLIKRDKSGFWKPLENNLFLPRQSFMTYMHHSHWHMKSLIDLQDGQSSSLHYSTVHAASKHDLEQIKTIATNFLKKTREIVEPSPEEEIFCINLDVFKI